MHAPYTIRCTAGSSTLAVPAWLVPSRLTGCHCMAGRPPPHATNQAAGQSAVEEALRQGEEARLVLQALRQKWPAAHLAPLSIMARAGLEPDVQTKVAPWPALGWLRALQLAQGRAECLLAGGRPTHSSRGAGQAGAARAWPPARACS